MPKTTKLRTNRYLCYYYMIIELLEIRIGVNATLNRPEATAATLLASNESQIRRRWMHGAKSRNARFSRRRFSLITRMRPTCGNVDKTLWRAGHDGHADFFIFLYRRSNPLRDSPILPLHPLPCIRFFPFLFFATLALSVDTLMGYDAGFRTAP